MNLSQLGEKIRPIRRFIPLPLAGLLLVLMSCQVYQMDKFVRSKFEGKRWRLPSSVYARPLELYQGAAISQKDFEAELRELSYAKVGKASAIGEYAVNGNEVAVFRKSFVFFEGPEDSLKFSVRFDRQGVADLTYDARKDDDGIVRLDPLKIGGIYPSEREDRKLVQLKNVPRTLIDALIAIEDRDFYDHFGVSIRGISRAVLSNVKAGRLVQGGSTLTQQLVKNFYLTNERSLKRKAIEAIYSVLLEVHYSKDEILETYINEIYLGQSGDNAVHGFGLASEFYFGRPIERLSLEQSALLAALVNGPSHFNPTRFPDRAKKRRNHILDLLLDMKKISKVERDVAQRQPIRVRPPKSWQLNRFPAYLDLVRRNLQRDYKEDDLAEEGLRVFTGFDPIVQISSQAAAQEFLSAQGKAGRNLQIASVVVSESGEVQALIGDRNTGYQGFNRALDAKRSIGSLAKPVVLLAALRDSKYSLASQISDEPIRVPLGSGNVWEPQNFDHESHGQVSLLKMLTQSYNQATVRLGTQVGLKRVRDTFKKLSGADDLPLAPSIMLGSVGMSPFNVASMYYTIFSGGYRADLRAVRGVQTTEGKPVKSYASKIRKEFDADVMHLMHYAMRAVVFEGTGRAAFNYLPMDIHAAGKTGTSNEQRDSWFAGFTGDKLAVAWVGNDQHLPTKLTGSSGGLAVWAKIMAKVAHKPLSLKTPENVSYQWVDAATGQLSQAGCLGVKYLPFMRKTVPAPSALPCRTTEDEAAEPSAASESKPSFDWFFERNE